MQKFILRLNLQSGRSRKQWLIKENHTGQVSYCAEPLLLMNAIPIVDKQKAAAVKRTGKKSACSWILFDDLRAASSMDLSWVNEALRLHYNPERSVDWLTNTGGNCTNSRFGLILAMDRKIYRVPGWVNLPPLYA